VFGGVADRREKQKRRIKVMTLRELRQQSKKTAAEVAAALGVTYNAVSQYENGLRRISLESVLTLAKLYDVSAEEIIQAQLKTEKERE
jgi:transcriptional regulator with XRE-family HTH domain